ncbi:hypothetical protein C8F04DRAFT_1236908 [Mycena alexandri]|uniref:Uncharacterized protein n=1 Tax=Mycena alexandri TaxID=1745969 RepID=A0AAD6SNR3_9AGAR|nr:hypothetical protein C8F04DRAFT_1236908 [Mycena alexandri]
MWGGGEPPTRRNMGISAMHHCGGGQPLRKEKKFYNCCERVFSVRETVLEHAELRNWGEGLTTAMAASLLGPSLRNIFSRVQYRRSRGLQSNLRDSRKRTATNDKAKASQEYIEIQALARNRGLPSNLRDSRKRSATNDKAKASQDTTPAYWTSINEPLHWAGCAKSASGMGRDSECQGPEEGRAAGLGLRKVFQRNGRVSAPKGWIRARLRQFKEGENTSEAKKRNQNDKPQSSLIRRNSKPTSGPEFKLRENYSGGPATAPWGGSAGQGRPVPDPAGTSSNQPSKYQENSGFSGPLSEGPKAKPQGHTRTPIENFQHTFKLTLPKLRVEESKTTAPDVARDTLLVGPRERCAESPGAESRFPRRTYEVMHSDVGIVPSKRAIKPPEYLETVRPLSLECVLFLLRFSGLWCRAPQLPIARIALGWWSKEWRSLCMTKSVGELRVGESRLAC